MSLFTWLFGSTPKKDTTPAVPKDDNRIFIAHQIENDTAFEWNNTEQFINQNMAVTGGMGAGKTQLIKSFLLDMDKVNKKIIIDYKADYTDKSFLKYINGEMVDLKKEPLPFNPMLGNSFDSNPTRDIKYRLATILQSYSRMMGGKQVGAFRGAVETYLNDKETLGFKNFTQFVEYANENELLDGAFVSEVLEPLAEFNIFPANEVTFEDFMKNGKTSVIVVKNMYSNQMKNLVSHVIVEHLYPYMLANRKSKLYNGANREIQTLLLIDEAKTIMGDKVESLISILKEGREFGYAVLFGTQYLEDFDQKKGYKYLKYFPTRFNGKNNDEEHKTLKPHHFEIDEEHQYFTPYWKRVK